MEHCLLVLGIHWWALLTHGVYIQVLCGLISGPGTVTGAEKMLNGFFFFFGMKEWIHFSPHCLWNLFSFISPIRERKIFVCGEGNNKISPSWHLQHVFILILITVISFRKFHINGQLLCSSLTIHWHYIHSFFFLIYFKLSLPCSTWQW